jgi:hypothetical protein
MPLFLPAIYIEARESFSYDDLQASFEILQTGALPFVGRFEGIFPREVPPAYHAGINLRKFENICSSVFESALNVGIEGNLGQNCLSNIIEVVCAIVHWKMASQGGRAPRNVQNVRDNWTPDTHIQLLAAYQQRSMGLFRIDGVRIPTATTLLRFTDPQHYGVMDSRVVRHTQGAGITTLGLRNDGYINDTQPNVRKYYDEYMPFLEAEARDLNINGATFHDVNATGDLVQVRFRPCDVEMALFHLPEPQ